MYPMTSAWKGAHVYLSISSCLSGKGDVSVLKGAHVCLERGTYLY